MFGAEFDPAHALTTLLLELHERAHELAYREFQRFCMTRVERLIPFDAGLLGMGTIQHGVPRGHDVLLDRRPPEFMESWEDVKHQDVVAIAAMSHPGKTVNVSLRGPEFANSPDAAAHCERWGIAHVLCTACIDARSGLYTVMSVYREDHERPFSERERASLELIVPHVIVAARQARLRQLREASALTAGDGRAVGVVNDEGLLLEAEPAFIDLLRADQPRWHGPWLPELLWQELQENRERQSAGGVFISAHAVNGLWLVYARRMVAADTLTHREREIARAFASGETYREIAEGLGIAPNTVRRHLANVYEKLGISSKAELDRMLR